MSDLGLTIEYYGECLVETMPNYSQFQFQLAFGNVINNCNDKNLELILDSIPTENRNSLFNNVSVIRKLWKEEKISSPDKLIYLINLELPSYQQHQGLGTKVLQQLLFKSKKEGFEYLLCNPVTSAGNNFIKKNKFENIVGNYWGIKV
jgi:hypothetical protein